jgi:uncharacterized lipoprotein YddW (UPF0748 family)
MRISGATVLIAVAALSASAQPPAKLGLAPSGARPDTSIVPPPVQREFRGVWVATVNNIDWPSKPGLSTADQQRELTAILDRVAELHLNAVIFQVRPSADALYASKIEPWSAYLTGRMGQAPDPLWDPLAFAVREAHARGLLLHAWFNPFRARYPGDNGPAAANHVSRTSPGMVYRYGGYQWMDPGNPAARTRALRVIMDVVTRYDVDGVHLDDTFYPYPVTRGGRIVEFPDAATYRAYRRAGGTLGRDDWRRQNINTFVQELYAQVKRAKPWVKVGISPFGIWRPSNPPGIQGFDAYDQLFADSRLWLQRGWLDYLAPQLYWRIDQPAQSYPSLLSWWVRQDVQGRHIWPGHYAMRVADPPGKARPWPASEIVDQIRLTRDQAGADGDILFSMSALMTDADSLDERLLAGPYAEPALAPAFPWLDSIPPAPPLVRAGRVEDAVTLVRFSAGDTLAPPARWVVQARADGRWYTRILPASARADTLTGAAGSADAVGVIAVDRAGNESQPVVIRLSIPGVPAPTLPAPSTAQTPTGGNTHEWHPAPQGR